jgi:transcriptional antiterminator NusG
MAKKDKKEKIEEKAEDAATDNTKEVVNKDEKEALNKEVKDTKDTLVETDDAAKGQPEDVSDDTSSDDVDVTKEDSDNNVDESVESDEGANEEDTEDKDENEDGNKTEENSDGEDVEEDKGQDGSGNDSDNDTGDPEDGGDNKGDDEEKTKKKKGKEEGVITINSDIPEDAKWYVVHTYSGHENKVAVTLKQRVEAAGYLDRIFKMYIPQQKKIVVSEGKKRSVEERLYPGYLMVQMLMDDDSWYVVRSTPGVTGFVGMGSTPTPLKESEVKDLMRHTKVEAPKFEAKFTIGDSVKINEGPFRDFLGKVDEVNEEQGKVRVLVSVFGRETPVELDFTQVNRI